ncbi:hypothetical protein AVEN_129008-3 [Araneus ventricosus]|uniref:Uncharacterized protein n=1 Tax=Araneus ventricosus TaxID=182803 RepID=A0A4Y2LRH4_ARAVE|nr:hypothetical protein AVEN_129008-3 [Araneus ventricosus]
MASTPEQVVCTPTFVFPTAFPVNGFQLWKDEPKDTEASSTAQFMISPSDRRLLLLPSNAMSASQLLLPPSEG